MTYCTNSPTVASSRCDEPRGWNRLMCAHGSHVWMPQRCRKCGGCRYARRAKVILRIANGASSDLQPALLTLTSVPGSSWEGVMREWSHMVRWLRKTSPQIQYAASKEEGSDTGMKHLHVVLINFRYTPQVKIAAEWRRLTGAHVVRIERLKTERAYAYVAKYVSKDMTATRKNVTFSAGWPKLPPSGITCVKIDSVGPWGPSKLYLITAKGAIVEKIVADCSCWGPVMRTDLKEALWLRSKMAPSRTSSKAE